MADGVSADAAGTAQTKPVPASSAQASEGPENDKAAQLEKRLADAEAQLSEFRNFRSAELRRRQEATKADKPEGKSEAEATLTERVRALESRNAKYADKRRIDALRDAAKAEGVPTERVEGVVRFLIPDVGSKLRYDDDADSVHYVDELEQERPVSTLVKEFLKRPEGKIYLPDPQTSGVPRGNGSRVPAGQVPISQLGREERLKLTSEERARRYREEAGLS